MTAMILPQYDTILALIAVVFLFALIAYRLNKEDQNQRETKPKSKVKPHEPKTGARQPSTIDPKPNNESQIPSLLKLIAALLFAIFCILLCPMLWHFFI